MEETKRRRFIIRAVLEGEVDVSEEPVSPYQFVEFIESSGTQYLDTGLNVTEFDKVEIDYLVTNPKIWTGLFGVNETGETKRIGYNNPVTVWGMGWYSQVDGFTAPSAARHLLSFEGVQGLQKVIIDGNTVLEKNHNTQPSGSYSAYLFAINYSGAPKLNELFYAKMYSCKISLNGDVVADLRPAIRKEDNAVGMYDAVRDIFLENQGSGAFTAGPEI